MATAAEVEAYYANMWRGLVVPHLFAVLVGALASGACFTQIVYFFSQRARPGASQRRLDTVLVSLMALSTALLVCVEWWGLYNTLVLNNTNNFYPQLFHTSDWLIPPFAAVGLTASQIWFAERAWKVTNGSWLFAFCSAGALGVSFAASMSLAINGITKGDRSTEWDSLRRQIVTWLFSGAAADLLSTFVLLWQARRFALQNRGTGAKEGTNAVLKLVRLAFATGSLTSATALVGGAVYITTHAYSNDFLPFVDALPRLSILSCLITIQSRDAWRITRASQSLPTTIRLPELGFNQSSSGGSNEKQPPPRKGSTAGLYANSPQVDSHGGASSGGGSSRETKHHHPLDMPVNKLRNWKLPQNESPTASPKKGMAAKEHRRSYSDGGVRLAHVSEVGSGGDLERALKYYQKDDKEPKGFETPKLEVVEAGKNGMFVLDWSRAGKGKVASPAVPQQAAFRKHGRTLSGITVQVEQQVVRD